MIRKNKKNQSNNGKYPLYGSVDIIGNCDNADYNGEYVLVARVGAYAGKTRLIKGKCGITDNTLIIDSKKELIPYFILSYLINYNLNKLIFGSGQPLITGKQLKNIKCNYPSISEQFKIVKFLSLIDKKIELLEKKCSLYQSLKSYLLENLFSKKLRFNKFSEEWETYSLGDFVKIKSGKSPKNILDNNGIIPYFKVEQLNYCEKYLEKTPYFINGTEDYVKKGSIIFPKRGMAIMSNKIRILNQDSFMDTNLMSLTIKKDELNNEFLFYYLTNEKLSKLADTTSIPQLNNKHILPLKIQIPSILEQQKIVKLLSSIDLKIDKIKENNVNIKYYKKGLLQKMFV